MKKVVVLTIFLLFASTLFAQRRVELGILDSLFATNGAKGSILIFDPVENIYWSNDFCRAQEGFMPASTFKIPSALIALETGCATMDTLFRWDAQKQDFENWECDMTLAEAFERSCVPVFRGLARSVGEERMRKYIKSFNYGSMDICTENIDLFWLEGNSRVSQIEQIRFLERLHNSDLPLKESTMESVRQIMVRDKASKYVLRGKTGWSGGRGYIGWFVGYVECQGRVYYFALNAEPIDRANTARFLESRVGITMDALRILAII